MRFSSNGRQRGHVHEDFGENPWCTRRAGNSRRHGVGFSGFHNPRAGPACCQHDLGSNPFANDPAAPAAGRALFDGACSACHGTGAGGSERGPALSSGTFQHGGADTDIFQTIRAGVSGTAMPAFTAMPTDNVWRLVTYIKSLSGQNGPRGTATGNVIAGRDLFFGTGGCTSCHEVDGRGAAFRQRAFLPKAQRPVAAAIRAGVMHQPAAGGRGGGRGPAAARPVDIVTLKGEKIHALSRGEDTFYIQVEDASGKWTTYEKSKLKSITPAGNASPSDIATRLNPTQINDIVAFLASHKERNLAETAKAMPRPVLTYDRLVKSEPQNWPTYWGDYAARHFSDLTQINTGNVERDAAAELDRHHRQPQRQQRGLTHRGGRSAILLHPRRSGGL